MTNENTQLGVPVESFDKIALDLQGLRETTGPVSYADLVRLIAKLRLALGVSAAAATPARSTVYNAFCTGRTRMDTDLISDIVLALGASADQAEHWVQRCREARRNHEAALRALRQVPVVTEEEIAAPEGAASASPNGIPWWRMALFILIAVVANHGFRNLIAAPLDVPLYLDMIGTAVVALTFGPWPGVLVATVTGVTGALVEEGIIAFTLINIVGALVWGYGVRKFSMGASIPRFFALNLIVATVCSIIATPILLLVRGGAYGAFGEISASLQDAGLSFVAATFTSNIATSVLDKLLTGFIAITVFAWLHTRIGSKTASLPVVDQMSVKLVTSPSMVSGSIA